MVLGTPNAIKATAKYLGKLKEAGLVSMRVLDGLVWLAFIVLTICSYSRPETREGAQKPIMREYFFIDYRRAIDATKYRIHKIDQKIKAEGKPNQEKKELRCKQCKSEWTTLEVLDNIDPWAAASGRGSGFLCKRCNFPLDSIAQNGEAEQDDLPARFNRQFGPLLSLLQQIDSSFIPATSGEMALADALPVPRGKGNERVKTEPIKERVVQPTTVKGVASGPEKIEIVITTEADQSAAAQKAELDRRAQVAASNALPTWHTHSTVTNEWTAVGIQDAARRQSEDEVTPAPNDSPAEKAYTKAEDTAMDAYFAALAAEQEEQRRRAAAGEENEDEDEEDEEGEDEADEEEEEEEEDMEFEDTLLTVPETNGEPEAKRVKLDDGEPTQAGSVAVVEIAPTSTGSAAGEESDEDDEFEDAI